MYNNNASYRQNSNNWNRQQQRQQKKHSGCNMRTGKNGKNVIYGWNYSKRFGLVKFVATMRNTKNVCSNSKGETLEIYVVTIQKPFAEPQTITGFWNPQQAKLRMPDLNMTASPMARNGGYWGRTSVKKR